MRKMTVVFGAVILLLLTVGCDIGAWADEPKHEEYESEEEARPDEEPSSVEEWIRRYENSDDPIDQALIRYWRESESSRTREEILMSVIMTPSAKKALRHLTDLGPDYVDEMLERIEAGSLWAITLIYAVMEIEGVRTPELEVLKVPMSEENLRAWVERFRELTGRR